MGRASDAQHAFTGGEWSPLLKGRQDLEKYKSAMATCLNAVPLAQGGWTRRPGTEFINQARHHDKECRLFRFEYSVTQAYIVEIGNFYIRFYTEGGISTQAARAIDSITKANPGVVTDVGHGYSDSNRLKLSGMTGMVELEGREVSVFYLTADTYSLRDSDGNNIDTTNFGTFTAGNSSKIIEVASPYPEAELPYVRVVQSADVMYLMHPRYQTRTLTRTSATTWSLVVFTSFDGPYDAINTTSTTLTASATTGAVTVTASSATGINGGQGFLSTDGGRLIRMKVGSTWGYGAITSVTSNVQVAMLVINTLGGTTATSTWRLGLWSETTGFPSVGTFHEDRLCLCSPTSYPNRIDLSKSGNYTDFSPSATDGTVANDNAIAFTFNSTDVNAVRWVESDEKGLIAGTMRSEWLVRPSVNGEALTPVNTTAKPSTNRGSADTAAVRAGSTILFAQHGGRKIRELAWVFEKDSFRAPDMTLLSEHITNPGIVELAYQDQPQEVLWAPRSDGVLLGFTYERDQNVTAWHRHELGGASDAADTLVPIVERISTGPSADGSRDELWMVVQRYVNGGTKRYIERVTKLWESGDVKEDAFFLDCGATKTNAAPTVTFTGFHHLEGETVSALADGARHVDVVVTNAAITLDYAAVKVTVGYAYPSDGQSMPIEAGSQDGSAQGKTKRLVRVGFILFDTLGLKYGPNADNLSEILNTEWGDDFGEATELASGVFRGSFDGDYDRSGQCFWRADGPFPATVLAYLPQVDTSDDS